jgi:hypothetical protein
VPQQKKNYKGVKYFGWIILERVGNTANVQLMVYLGK